MGERLTTGGYFWDVLLLSTYNEYWEDFYLNMVKVLPCEKCIKNTEEHLSYNPVPKFKDTNEKNEYLWENEVKEKGYTLETWRNHLGSTFTRI
jgi:hypothetical protein